MPDNSILHLPFIVNALALALAFLFSDNFVGGGFGWDRLSVDHGGKLHGRGSYYVALPLIALGFAVGGTIGLLLSLLWLIYRAAFPFTPHTLAPVTGHDKIAAFVRHFLPTPVVLFGCILFDVNPVHALPFVAYAFSAAYLASWYGHKVDTAGPWDELGRDADFVERARGAAWGLAMALALSPLLG